MVAGTMPGATRRTSTSTDREFRAPIGTHDVLPPESDALDRRWSPRSPSGPARFGFDLVVTPIFEHLEVFQRVGGVDRRRPQGDVRLRRQGRPPHRAAARGHRAGRCGRSSQHRPTAPWKVWYVAPHFRYERPQKGRYRQHWQVGAEVLGVDDPQRRRRGHRAGARLLPRRSACATFTLRINSMGDAARRAPRTSRCCARTCSTHGDALGDEFRERVEANPLRVLDSKRRRLAGRDRARAADHRVPRATTPRDALRGGAARARRARHRATRSTRGSCAASTTTRAPRSSSRATRSTPRRTRIGGGGRYDGLVEQMGGKPTPGIGFGIGIERVLIACDAEGVLAGAERAAADVFVVDGLGTSRPPRSRCSSPSSARTACAPSAPTATGR